MTDKYPLVWALVTKKFAGDAETAEATIPMFDKMFSEPPTSQLEVVCGEKFTDERARSLLFSPSEDDLAKLYPALLIPPESNVPKSHPQHATYKHVLAMFHNAYAMSFKHWRPFLLNNGFLGLVESLTVKEDVLK